MKGRRSLVARSRCVPGRARPSGHPTSAASASHDPRHRDHLAGHGTHRLDRSHAQHGDRGDRAGDPAEARTGGQTLRAWVVVPATVVSIATAGVAIWAAIEHEAHAATRETEQTGGREVR